jgi:hypothetical protein
MLTREEMERIRKRLLSGWGEDWVYDDEMAHLAINRVFTEMFRLQDRVAELEQWPVMAKEAAELPREKWGFSLLVFMVRQLLAVAYPADIFPREVDRPDGSDAGPELVRSLAHALDKEDVYAKLVEANARVAAMEPVVRAAINILGIWRGDPDDVQSDALFLDAQEHIEQAIDALPPALAAELAEPVEPKAKEVDRDA